MVILCVLPSITMWIRHTLLYILITTTSFK